MRDDVSLLLQAWGAGFYLVSKVLLSHTVHNLGRRATTTRRGGVPPLCEAGVVVRFHATAEAA